MKKTIFILFSVFFLNTSYAQDKYLTTIGYMDFFSHSPLEDIKAVNHQVLSIIDFDTNEIVIHVLIKSFFFEKSLMQEHFNENYMESDKYPKAKFKGKIIGFNRKNKNPQKVAIAGEINIHGISKKIRISSIIKQKNGKIYLKGYFYVLVKDFDVKIPGTKRNNIARSIKISFDIKHKKRKKHSEQ